MRKMLLPIDSENVPEKVMAYLKDFVTGMQYEVTLLNVISAERIRMNREARGVYDVVELDLDTPSKAMLTTFEAKLRAEGINSINVISATGDPADVIVKTADSGGFHLIMMCTHGMGAAKRLLIGSVTNKVVHHSEVPVLVIRE